MIEALNAFVAAASPGDGRVPKLVMFGSGNASSNGSAAAVFNKFFALFEKPAASDCENCPGSGPNANRA